jgi:hypothetical protein
MARWEFDNIVNQLRTAQGYARYGKDGARSDFLTGYLGGMVNMLEKLNK